MLVAANWARNAVGQVHEGVCGRHERKRHQVGALWEITILGLQMIRDESTPGHWISATKVLLHQGISGFFLSLFLSRILPFVLFGPRPTGVSAFVVVIVTLVVAAEERGNLGVVVLDRNRPLRSRVERGTHPLREFLDSTIDGRAAGTGRDADAAPPPHVDNVARRRVRRAEARRHGTPHVSIEPLANMAAVARWAERATA